MPGGNYGYHPRGRGQTHWHEEQPGVVPKILRTGFGSPTGMCVYEGTLLPKKYRGQLLHTDAGPRQVRCYHLKPKGAGYEVEREDMVDEHATTGSGRRDVCVAPDGSVFVADWYDPGVGGHGMGDTTRGRIFRLAPKGHKPSVPKVESATRTRACSRRSASPALSVRYMAMAKLRSRNLPRPSEDARRVLELEVLQRRSSKRRSNSSRALSQLHRIHLRRPGTAKQHLPTWPMQPEGSRSAGPHPGLAAVRRDVC